MKTSEIRKLFLNFFKSHKHIKLKSSKIIPNEDPSLLFTNSGMVPFKNIFLGKEKIKYLQVASSQCCVRVGGKHNDLENVGYTNFHNTFFEMLGNFSFGSYFKQNAIKLAWTFLIKELKISKKNLFVTVHYKDKKSYYIWLNEIGISKKRIFKFDKENFWQMNNMGPCGYCTEIYFCKNKNLDMKNISLLNKKNFIELWNLVFIQFEKDIKGNLYLLPNTSVDTGMGLERIASIKQNVFCNYEIDVFKPLLNEIKYIINVSNLKKEYLKIIADHIRSSAFLISEGLLPNKKSHGYVLRRLIRRSLIYGYKIGVLKPYLYKLIDILDTIYGKVYKKLHSFKENIKKIILKEELKFIKLLDKGMNFLNKKLLNKFNYINGSLIFKLYDTYGLPYDLIKYFLTENNIKFDNLGFKKEMINYKFKSKKKYLLNTKIVNIDKKNYLINFNIYKYKTNISFIFDKNGKNINFINEKNNGFILLNKTSFFFESCGQVGDVGYIYNDLGKFKVKNVIKYKNLYLHIGVLLKGILFINNKVNIYIDKLYRYKIKKNHSATHLLNETLKRVLNVNLVQKGSLINNKNLTFDFNYHKNISNEKLFIIEKLINNEILKNNIIFIKKLSLKKINKIKAVALFENKYLKEKLNVVFIGKKNSYSIEVCNGLHVESTNKIGVFCIILEKSISKGIRRIEALTDKNAICYLLKNKLLVNNVSDIFKQNIYNIKKNILNIINKKNELIDNLREIKNININFFIKKLLKKILYLYKYRILIEKIKIYYKNDLYLIINNLINKLFNKSIIIIYIKINNNINLFIRLTNDFLKKKLNSKIILNKLFINNKNIIYSKKNIFSYISTNKKNVKNLNLIKNILKNILKLY